MSDVEQANASVETTRHLVRLVRLTDVIPHSNADRMELAIIEGWQSCVPKGQYKKDDYVIFCEIDALLPIAHPYFGFLEERGGLKQVGEIVYSRVKTIKLRKELSQGVVVPVAPSDLDELIRAGGEYGNLTEYFGVLKYEGSKKKSYQTADIIPTRFQRFVNWVRGPEREYLQLPWPSFLDKSEQPRVQNLFNAYGRALQANETFEVSVKLDGSSMTAFRFTSDEVSRCGVCSRNAELKQDDIVWPLSVSVRNWIADLIGMNRRMFRIRRFGVPTFRRGIKIDDDHFISTYRKLNLAERLNTFAAKHGVNLAIQGELIGPGVEENFENVPHRIFCVYSVYLLHDLLKGGPPHKLLPAAARSVVQELISYSNEGPVENGGVDICYIPVIHAAVSLPSTIQDCLKYAEGPSAFKGKFREGVVFKSTTRDFSFKVISNAYLLKKEDELAAKEAERAALEIPVPA